MRRTADRLDPTGVSRPSPRVRRGSSPPHRHSLRLLLQRAPDSPVAEQRRPNPSTDPPDRADHSGAHPRWPAPPILSDVVSGRDRYRRIEFRKSLFENGCPPDLAYRVDFLLTTPRSVAALSPSCGLAALETEHWRLLRRAAYSE